MRAREVLVTIAMLAVAAVLVVANARSRGPAPRTVASPSPSGTNEPFAVFDLEGPPLDWSRPTPTGTTTVEGYVGSATCGKCHGEVAARWASRPMADTGMHRITARTAALDAIFDGSHVVRHDGSGFSYRPLHDDRGYFVEERLDAPDGRPLHVRREPITLSFTAGASGAAFGFER